MRRFTGICGLAVLTLGVVCLEAGPARAAPTSPTQAKAAPARDTYDGPPPLLGAHGRTKVGGYGSMGAGYTRFMGRESGLMSLEGAVLFDHRLSLGFAGYGFSRTVCGCRVNGDATTEIGSGYGGFVARYSVLTRLPVYASLGLLLGGGATNLHPKGVDDPEDPDGWNNDRWDEGEYDSFLVLQPEATLHINVTRWFRVGASVGYRFTGGVTRFGLNESDLNGPLVGGSLQFGWF